MKRRRKKIVSLYVYVRQRQCVSVCEPMKKIHLQMEDIELVHLFYNIHCYFWLYSNLFYSLRFIVKKDNNNMSSSNYIKKKKKLPLNMNCEYVWL